MFDNMRWSIIIVVTIWLGLFSIIGESIFSIAEDIGILVCVTTFSSWFCWFSFGFLFSFSFSFDFGLSFDLIKWDTWLWVLFILRWGSEQLLKFWVLNLTFLKFRCGIVKNIFSDCEILFLLASSFRHRLELLKFFLIFRWFLIWLRLDNLWLLSNVLRVKLVTKIWESSTLNYILILAQTNCCCKKPDVR